jgi:hypothetical protein
MKRILALAALTLSFSTAATSLDEADITAKTDDGSVLKTSDGKTWAVDRMDQIDTSLWTVGDTVIEDDDSKACLHVRLINKDEDNETACVKKLD